MTSSIHTGQRATGDNRYPNVRYVRVFAIAIPSVVCLSVTSVHLTQGLNLSAIFLHRCVPWSSFDLRAKFFGYRPRGTPPSGALNARGVAK